MRIILDESAPQKLRLLIDSQHAVVTTWFQGWSGLKNGALLAAANEAGFEHEQLECGEGASQDDRCRD